MNTERNYSFVFRSTDAKPAVRWISILLTFSLLLGLTACSSSKSSTTSPSGVTGDRIEVSELPEPVDGLSAYDLVSRYNSNWLQKRGPTSIHNPVPIKVYLDGTGSPYGSVESLRELRAANIALIRHFDANEAQFRFGVGNVAGAILVHTKGGGE